MCSFGRSPAKRPKVLVVSGAFTFGSSFDQELDDIKVSVLDGKRGEECCPKVCFQFDVFRLRFVDEELDDLFGIPFWAAKWMVEKPLLCLELMSMLFSRRKRQVPWCLLERDGPARDCSSPSSSFYVFDFSSFSPARSFTISVKALWEVVNDGSAQEDVDDVEI